MRAREIRALARESLQGNWGKGALLTLVYLLLVVVISFILRFIPFIGLIADIVISPVLSFGLLASFIKLSRNTEVSYLDFFKNGFDAFGKVWGVAFHTIIKMILPVLVIVVSVLLISASSVLIFSLDGELGGVLGVLGLILYVVGIIWTIIKYYSYVLTSYILNDRPDLSSKEIVAASEELMKGNKWRYFCLSLSFIGWNFLVILTFGIGYLWLLPYVQIASVKFYEEINN